MSDDSGAESGAESEAADAASVALENVFDVICERGMAAVHEGQWAAAKDHFVEAMSVDKREESDITEERADCAYNLACCSAQIGELDEAEAWLRRAILWGVRDVSPETDDHLEPLRADSGRYARLRLVVEGLGAPLERVPAAVLQRSRRPRTGRNMDRLVADERARDDSFWGAAQWEEEDDEEFAEGDADEHAARDVFDSDFDDTEDEEDDDEVDEDGEKVHKKKEKKVKEAPKPKKVAKAAPPSAAPRSKRAAAAQAEQANSAAVGDMDDDDDDDDDDFADAAVDADLAAPPPQRGLADDVRDARRKRQVDAIWSELAGSDAGGENAESDAEAPEAPEAPEPPKKKKKVAKEKVKASSKSKAQSVLAGIFGAKSASQICKKAEKSTKKRAATAASAPTQSRGVVRKREVVEERTFAGETIQVRRTVRDAGAAAAEAPKSGIDRVLAEIKGVAAVSTVAKSSSDWDAFKESEGLDESLKDADKKGFLGRQDFLERCDVRKFDQERSQRDAERLTREAAAQNK
ncbi:bucentaur or craniofacial development-domain-containing protein [Pelagophyceae sp. CCMP2097]|nr:bucentaur or craniofacial development-domain-containing protein [Pelagophyceae sp. CCMP2097]